MPNLEESKKNAFIFFEISESDEFRKYFFKPANGKIPLSEYPKTKRPPTEQQQNNKKVSKIKTILGSGIHAMALLSYRM